MKRRLSDVEKKAIEIYTKCPTFTVELIAQLLFAPAWLVTNIIFKYLNGSVKGDYLLNKKLTKPVKLPRSGVFPTPPAVVLALQELKDLGITITNNKDN